MGFVFPGIEQSCSGLDLIIGRQLWREKIEPELERGEQSQGVLCKPVQSRKRIRILFLPRFAVLFDRLYMHFGPTIRFVPFLLRRFYSLHHLVHPDLETSLIPFLFGCRENAGKYKMEIFLVQKWKWWWRRKRKGISFPVRNKGREKVRLKRTVCTLQRYKCNAPLLPSPMLLLYSYDLPLCDTAVRSSCFIIFFMLEKYFLMEIKLNKFKT